MPDSRGEMLNKKNKINDTIVHYFFFDTFLLIDENYDEEIFLDQEESCISHKKMNKQEFDFVFNMERVETLSIII